MSENAAGPFAHRPRHRWRRVSVEVPDFLADAAADILEEATGSGIEIVAASPATDGAGRERLIGYIDGEDPGGEAQAALGARLEALAARAGVAGAIMLSGEPLLEEDWGSGWKDHFHPFHVTPRLVIKPSWEPYEPRSSEAVIEMDPGMAFGTGQHPSTRLALELIEKSCAAAAPGSALDIGTGTGILAMAAALRGAGQVMAIDTDPDAVRAARDNVSRNLLAGRVSVEERQLFGIGRSFDLIAANITADVLLGLRESIVERLAPGGALVLAGLLAGGQADEVRAAYARLGLSCAGVREEGGWAALLLCRDAAPAAASGGEESFEIVDEQGRIIGRALRSVCHRTPSLLHRAAHVVVTDGRARIYLQKRSMSKDIQPGKWDTSVGGHVGAGEDHEAGARREMLEELGLSGKLRFLHRYVWRTARESELVETWLHVAACEPRPQPGEIDEGRWFTLEQAAQLVARGEATPNLAEELRLGKDLFFAQDGSGSSGETGQ